jgi:hypothetical protein
MVAAKINWQAAKFFDNQYLPTGSHELGSAAVRRDFHR